jgi:hypothetical protein
MHLTEAEQIIASVSANPSTAFCKRCAVYPNTVGWVDSFGLAQDKSPIVITRKLRDQSQK